ETSFAAEEASQPVIVTLRELAVAPWWLMQRKYRRHWPLPELNNVTAVGLDFAERGKHEVKVKRIAIEGKWVHTETLLLIILLVWMAIFLMEGGVRFYELYRTAQRERMAIRSLLEKQRSLEEENKHLEALADTDPLTGIHNRAGLRSRVDAEKIRSGALC